MCEFEQKTKRTKILFVLFLVLAVLSVLVGMSLIDPFHLQTFQVQTFTVHNSSDASYSADFLGLYQLNTNHGPVPRVCYLQACSSNEYNDTLACAQAIRTFEMYYNPSSDECLGVGHRPLTTWGLIVLGFTPGFLALAVLVYTVQCKHPTVSIPPELVQL